VQRLALVASTGIACRSRIGSADMI
jgi:hypothetical protein